MGDGNTAEIKIPTKDADLNTKLPSYSIVRAWEKDEKTDQVWAKNGPDDTILKNYWENAIKVSEYLERLDKNGLVDKAIEDPLLFRKLLVKLHKIQAKGILGDKPYNGQSIDLQLSANWQTEFRQANFNVRARVNSDSLGDMFDTCRKQEKKYFENEKNFVRRILIKKKYVNNALKEFNVDLYAPPSLFEFSPLTSHDVKEACNELDNAVPSKDRSSPLVCFTEEADEYAYVLFPSASFIPKYLERMRMSLKEFKSVKDPQYKRNHLSDAYHAGIRSQAFETVWNSEMMGIVNFFLQRRLGLKPVAHGDLDYHAFFLSQWAFRKHFNSHIDQFNA